MRIGVDISDLATGRADGTTRYTYELAKRLPALAPQHDWLYFSPAAPAAGYNLKPKTYNLLVSPWPKYWTQARLPFDLHRLRPDVLFMPIQQIPYVRPRRMKTVAVVHDLAVHRYSQQFTFKDWALLHIFSSYVARVADEIIAVSHATADDIARYYGRRDHVTVIHHGVDHERFYVPGDDELSVAWQEVARHYPQITKPYLLYVGQIQPRKNLERLIGAFEQLAGRDRDLKLVIAGGHGWMQQSIRQRARSSPAHDRIVMTGAVPSSVLTALLWHAEVFALPSLYEGFGLPVLEAFAAGCPVVTSNVSSLPEVAGDAAVLVDPKNVGAIAEGLRAARSSRAALTSRGLARAKQFSWDRTAKETFAVIEHV